MRPISTDTFAEALCRDLIAQMRVAAVPDGVAVPVTMLADFEALAKDKSIPKLAADGGVYIRSERKIYLNQSVLKNYRLGLSLAVLAHELGHAHSDYAGPLPTSYAHSPMSAYGAEEAYAERMACVWGFFEDVKQLRKSTTNWHASYFVALGHWFDESLYIQEMGVYWMKKNSGIIF